LELYTPQELLTIINRSAKILQVEIENEAAVLLGSRCRGTPRIANRVLRRCRDVAQVRGEGKITVQIAEKTLQMLTIDSDGLDSMDRRILECIIDHFNGGPVGLNTIGAALGEEPDTIEEVYEPYLIQKGFLARTPKGRTVTLNSYKKCNRVPPAKIELQPELFG
jgi:Holliday junction DNA helicase RuvB